MDDEKLLELLEKISDSLEKIADELLRKGQRRPAVRILLALPTVRTKEGIPVASVIALNNDEVYTFPILTDDGAGNAVPPPPGDTFAASGSDGGQFLGVVVNGTNLVLTPLVQVVSSPITVTVSDSQGVLQKDPQQFTIQNGVPVDIALGTPTTTTQPIPSNPGPG